MLFSTGFRIACWGLLVLGGIDDGGQLSVMPRYTGLELAKLKKEAISGDSSASMLLSRYYSVDMDDMDEGGFWLRLSSEQGGCLAHLEYSKYIFYKTGDVEKSKIILGRIDSASCDGERERVGKGLKSFRGLLNRSPHR